MSDHSLAVRDSVFLRVLRALKLVEVRPDGSTTHEAGADFATDHGVSTGYPHLNSLSAMASFPWVYSAVSAVASDLSKVPIRVRKGRGAGAEPIDDHPVLSLLDEPSTRVSSVLWRRQLITDLVLSGDAYVLIVGSREPEALLRLHPSRVKIIPLPDGQPDSYEYDGGGPTACYAYEQVLHVRSPSWSDEPSGLFGVGAIQSLHDDLVTERSTAALTASTAKTGRPTGIISPAEDGDRWSRDQIGLVRDAFESQMQKGSGVLIVGGAVSYEPVGWSPREMEFTSLRQGTREAILAALDVPPARVGLPNTNYATSLAQSRRYWEGLQGRAALIDAALTRLARQFPNSENVYVYHDFSDIDPLQESRTERVDRVVSWAMLGLPVGDAAALEGFDEFPTLKLDEVEEAPAESPIPPTEVEAAAWDRSESAWEAMETAQATDRGVLWKSIMDDVHTPMENAMAKAVRVHLRGQAARVAKRLEGTLGDEIGSKGIIQRADLSDDLISQLLDLAAEKIRLIRATLPTFAATIRRAFNQAVSELGLDEPVSITDSSVDALARRNAKNMADEMEKLLFERISKQINDLIDEGATIGDMQGAIMKDFSFSAERALRVARTETTKSVSAGQRAAYEDSAKRGIPLKIEWMAMPGARKAHEALDGQQVKPGEKFTVPAEAPGAGSTALHPGGFDSAALNVNCRCVLTGKVQRNQS